MENDKPTIGSVAGQLSGILNGVLTSAQVAVLERIVKQSTRAEAVWREYMEDA